jgi:Na+-transporting methylmalonyl-CoA/oxaloacetate decarboxylase gamma subunit
MKNIRNKIGITLLTVLLSAAGAYAQRVAYLRINEALVINENNFVDDYGNRSGWIELFNNSAGTVNVGGCYLTNDRNNPQKYPIPKGDVLTVIPPRQHILFWADGMANRGTFHVNFRLDPTKENYIALYDADGKTLVDEIVIPAGQKPDVSFGRKIDGRSEWTTLAKVTPSTNNLTLDSNEKIENFRINDSLGVGMTVTAMAVVFIGLILLYAVFKFVGKTAIQMSTHRAKKAGVENIPARGHVEEGAILAAIATALYEVTEDVHDIESTVLTIHKVTRRYSPWSSKIYGMREFFRK